MRLCAPYRGADAHSVRVEFSGYTPSPGFDLHISRLTPLRKSESPFALPMCYRELLAHNWQHSRRFQPAPTSYGLAGALSVVASLLRPSRLRRPGACSRHSVARWPPIPVSESQAFRLPYRVAVYVELTRPTYRAHHTGDSWLFGYQVAAPTA